MKLFSFHFSDDSRANGETNRRKRKKNVSFFPLLLATEAKASDTTGGQKKCTQFHSLVELATTILQLDGVFLMAAGEMNIKRHLWTIRASNRNNEQSHNRMAKREQKKRTRININKQQDQQRRLNGIRILCQALVASFSTLCDEVAVCTIIISNWNHRTKNQKHKNENECRDSIVRFQNNNNSDWIRFSRLFRPAICWYWMCCTGLRRYDFSWFATIFNQRQGCCRREQHRMWPKWSDFVSIELEQILASHFRLGKFVRIECRE